MIGIVGDGANAVAELVSETGGSAVTVDPTDVDETELDTVVALGEDVLYDLVRQGVEVPVLPVNAGRGIESVRRDALEDALDDLVSGSYETHSRPLLRVSVGPREYRALADVMLVTAEAARISEYAIRTGDGAAEDADAPIRGVDSVRADGIVVSTPTGSVGYGSDASGPVVAPSLDAVSVLPIAPFRVDRSNWVLAPPVRLSIEREEAAVALLVDDEEVQHVPTDESVDLTWGGSFTFVRSPVARAFFEGAERLEKT